MVPRGWRHQTDVRLKIEDARTEAPVSVPAGPTLRPYQFRLAWPVTDNGKEEGVLIGPTGSGKTEVGLSLIQRLGQRTLVLVHTKDLAQQWVQRVRDTLETEPGIIGDGQFSEGNIVTVALVQALARGGPVGTYGMVLVDECHRVPAAQTLEVLDTLPARYRFGLTATAKRRDGLESLLHLALGPTLAEVPQEAVLDSGAVLPVEVYGLAYPWPKRTLVDSWNGYLSAIGRDQHRNEMVTALVRKAVAAGRNTLVLTQHTNHCDTLADLLGDLQPVVLHGKLPMKVRRQNQLAAPAAKVIIGTYNLAGEGLDFPHLSGLVLASPVSAMNGVSPRLIQAIGRIRRPGSERGQAMVADIVDQMPLGLSAWRKRQTVYRSHRFELTWRG
jgi:superfamily II DNA or RNA helicase